MRETVLEILAQQESLGRVARQCTSDLNEAGFMVHQVLCGAFVKYSSRAPELIAGAMQRDMRALIDRSVWSGLRPS